MIDDEPDDDITPEELYDDLDGEAPEEKEESFSGCMPNGKCTDDFDEYHKAWKDFYQPVLDEFGDELELHVIGFDPTVLYGRKVGHSLDIPLAFHEAINDRIQELCRLRDFFFEMVKISKQAGFYPEVRGVIAKAEMGQYVDFELDPEPHYVDHATQTGMYDPEGS